MLQAERPIITIAGSDNLARTEHEVSLGEKIFRDITISSETRKEREEIEPNDKVGTPGWGVDDGDIFLGK